MTKLLTQAIEKVRELPASEQDAMATTIFAHMAGAPRYRLTDEQVKEVRRIQRDLHTGKTRLATQREMAALWKMCEV